VLKPVNGHGLVAANPVEAPEQVYSFLVLPDGRVMSYLNILWGFDQRPSTTTWKCSARPRPCSGSRFDGDTVVGAATDADAGR
jgi:levansucrase